MGAERLSHILGMADEIVSRAINDSTMVGCAVGIVHDGELVWAKGYGVADTTSGRPVTPDTAFRIGSISKTFTGIGIMQLVEQGDLSLDDPVVDRLKSFPFHQAAGARPVTIRDLLTHTSGIGELRSYRDILRQPVFGLGVKYGRPVPPLSEYYGEGLRPEIAPGRKWAYANHAVATLGQVIEDVSGQPFESYMIEHVFEPLGMTRTDFLRSDRVRDQLAVGYQLKLGRIKPVPDLDVVVRAAGSVYSSVSEMAHYAAALMNGGSNQTGRVLQADTLEEMFRPHFSVDPRLPGQGLTFLLDNLGTHRIVWHDGGWPGFVSSMLIQPERRLAVLAFTNTSAKDLHQLADSVMRAVLEAPAVGADLPRPGVVDSPQLWSELTGVYAPERGLLTNLRQWGMFGGNLEIVVRRGHLVARAPAGPLRKGVRLYAVDPADPMLLAGVVPYGATKIPLSLAFQRGSSGRVDAVAGHLLLPFRFVRRPALRSARTIAFGVGVGAAGLAAGVVRRVAQRRSLK